MMMKKTTSALAVAALLGTGAASAATFQVNDDTSLSIGGDIQMNYKSTTDGDGVDQDDFSDVGTSLVFSGESNIGNGLSTFFNIDLDPVDATEANSDLQSSGVDEASVGVAGTFGSVLVGSNGGAYDSYADFGDIAQNLGMTSISAGDISDLVQFSGSAGNVSYTVEAQVGDQEAANTSTTNLAAGASAELGAVSLSGAYEERGEDPVYGIGASAAIAGVSLTLGHEVDDAQANPFDKTSLTGSYGIGDVTLNFGMQNVSYDTIQNGDDDSFTETYFGALYSVASHMYVYAETLTLDADNDEGDNLGVGVYYGF